MNAAATEPPGVVEPLVGGPGGWVMWSRGGGQEMGGSEACFADIGDTFTKGI